MAAISESADLLLFRISRIVIVSGLIGLGLALPAPGSAGTYLDSSHRQSANRAFKDAKYNNYATGNCAHCHEAHASLDGSEPAPTVPAGANQSLAFNPTGSVCVTCHDGSATTKNVLAEITKAYSHPSGDALYEGRHEVSKNEAGQSGAPFRGASRHAECADCHNPHEAKAGTHAYNVADPASNNLISNVLKGSWGVEPSAEPGWKSANVAYTEVKPIVREYQLCFKCHSYYALQDNDGVTALTGPSGQLVTDQAMEFSRNLKSVHPGRTTLNNQTGSYAPRRLLNSVKESTLVSRLKAPWDGSAGIQTMYCSDCHGTNASGAGIPQGPHGSTNRYMLAGANQEWPRASQNADHLWTLYDLYEDKVGNNRYGWRDRLLCAKCHNLYDRTQRKFLNGVHNEGKHNGTGRFDHEPWKTQYSGGVPCVSCHIVVPHGSPRSRLIAYRPNPNDPYAADEPYTLTDYKKNNVNPNVIDGFKKVNTANNGGDDPYDRYSKKNCYITNNKGCGSHDSTDYSPFD